MSEAAAIEAAVRATGLLDGPVVVLLSGGRDSVCLLDLALRLASHDVRALHVDYALRPESGDDAAHCAALCERLHVPLEIVRAGPPPATGNVQAWARDVRYAAAAGDGGGAAATAAAPEADIATGHTASDQVETVLYRLAASPGRRALLGMRERDGRIVRPLLGITREQTGAYCAARALPFVDDATNATPKYARNRVRNELLPALRALHPAAEANVLRTLATLRDEAEVLDALVAKTLAAAGDPPQVARLAAEPAALRRLAVQALAGPDAPAIGARADEILALAPNGGSASLDLGQGLRAVVEYGRLRFEPGPPPPELDHGELIVERGADLPLGEGVLDAASCAAGLQVRSWRAGDRMRPLGLGGSRSLQDLFTDRKVPRARRASWPVITCEEEIAWVPGVATGERFRVTEATQERVRLVWRAHVP